MRPGAFGRIAIRAVDRYRRWGRGRSRGRCRFEPSCSTFALEAFRTRAFTLALASTAWRVIRCNPLADAGTRDPVRRRRTRGLRGNGLATAFTLMSLAGLFLLLLNAVASSQTLGGGCAATVNGASPPSLTRSSPLLVSEGQSVSVRGTVPPETQAQVPEDQMQSNTTITVSIVEGVGEVESSSHLGNGYEWGGSLGVDEYLKWGTGLYLVEGAAAGTGGWTCAASGYVKLDGNPLTKPAGQAAAGLTALGGAGAFASTLSKRRPTDAAPTAGDVKEDFGRDVDKLIGGKKPSVWERDLSGNALVQAGCLFFLFGPLALEGPVAGAAAVAAGRTGGRVWVRGHPVWGAISGLFLGIGVAVLGQQFALWPLTVLTGIAFPVYAAVLCGIRARIGRPFRRVGPAQPEAPVVPPAPPPTPPMP